MLNRKITALLLTMTMVLSAMPMASLADEIPEDQGGSQVVTEEQEETEETEPVEETPEQAEDEVSEEAISLPAETMTDEAEIPSYNGENTVEVGTLDALKYYLNCDEADIKLVDDIELGEDDPAIVAGNLRTTDPSGNYHIELNGHSITRTGGTGRLLEIREGSSVTIKNVAESESTFSGGISDQGGAILNEGKLDIYTWMSNICFENNNTTDNPEGNGGAIYSPRGSKIDLNGVRFFNNHAYNAGGAVYLDQDEYSSVLSSLVFENNEAQVRGGAVYLQLYDNNCIFVTDCTFNSNVAREGGAVYSYHYSGSTQSSVSCFGCTFTNNHAAIWSLAPEGERSPSGKMFYGGAICNSGEGDAYYVKFRSMEINDCSFERNFCGWDEDTGFSEPGEAEGCYGGAICSIGIEGHVEITDNTSFTYNRVDQYDDLDPADPDRGYGGAICLMIGGFLRLGDCLMQGNKCSGHGGAIYVESSTVEMGSDDDCPRILENMARYNGTGICAYVSDLTIYNCLIQGNYTNRSVDPDSSASMSGTQSQAAVSLINRSTLDLFGGTITGNYSRRENSGAGIDVPTDCTLNLYDTRFNGAAPIVISGNIYEKDANESSYADIVLHGTRMHIHDGRIDENSRIHAAYIEAGDDLTFAEFADGSIPQETVDKVFVSDLARNGTVPYKCRLTDNNSGIEFYETEFYDITTNVTGGGSISVSSSKAVAGDTVTFTLTPASGGELISVDVNGDEVQADEGVYSFVMPDEDVTVNAEFTNGNRLQGISVDLSETGRILIKATMFFTDGSIEAGTDHQIRFTQTKRDGTGDVVTVTDLLDGIKMIGNRYYYRCVVSAKEMTDDIRIELLYKGEVRKFAIGNTLVDSKTFTITDYAKVILSDVGCSQEAKSLAGAMLNYGEKSQIFFGYAADDLPSGRLTEQELAYYPDMSGVNKDSFACQGSRTKIDGKVEIIAASLVLKDTPYLKLYMSENGDYEYQVIMKGDKLRTDSNGAIRISIGDLSDLDRSLVIAVLDRNTGNAIDYLAYGPFNYCSNAYEKYTGADQEDFRDVLKSLYCFHKAAAAYG
ncbi:MAG: hypothetical protein IKE53_05640 [Clostridiales bacterium]|nr:hypothetical protein [Clostridiales bacterium]